MGSDPIFHSPKFARWAGLTILLAEDGANGLAAVNDVDGASGAIGKTEVGKALARRVASADPALSAVVNPYNAGAARPAPNRSARRRSP